MDLISIFRKFSPVIRPILAAKNRIFSLRVRGGRGNRVEGLDACLMRNCRVTFSGTGNLVQIGELSTLQDAAIHISGSNCHVTLGSRVTLMGCSLSLEGDGSAIEVGTHTYIYNDTELAALEGTTITLGEDCLLSSDIVIRTGDSHSILDASGKRINPSESITLGSHVWLGKGATVLKGASIGDHCVVATTALVTRSTETVTCAILAGSPAKPTRRDITWDHQLL